MFQYLYSLLSKYYPKLVCSGNFYVPDGNITASGFEPGNPPSHVQDDESLTRWANKGIGSWIQLEAVVPWDVCRVSIKWYMGDQRQYHFIISTSTDGSNFTDVFKSDSTGSTTAFENYSIIKVQAKYVRVTVNGNTDPVNGEWASIRELWVYTSSWSWA